MRFLHEEKRGAGRPGRCDAAVGNLGVRGERRKDSIAFMQVPKRRGENRRRGESGTLYVTADGLARLKSELVELERGVPELIAEVERTRAFGDFSENAEYQSAKHSLRRTYGRIMQLRGKIARAALINKSEKSGIVALGSTIVLEVNGKRVTYEILGSEETDPSGGRISYRSPLGVLLMNRMAGDSVTLTTKTGQVVYRIIEVQ